ncbi:helix-turn-helix domain-containing protein, partial [Paracoccus sp. PXZ]
ARQLLRDTELSVAEIAARLGYGEPSAFHRAFLKLAGTTPAGFRRDALSPPASTAGTAARR